METAQGKSVHWGPQSRCAHPSPMHPAFYTLHPAFLMLSAYSYSHRQRILRVQLLPDAQTVPSAAQRPRAPQPPAPSARLLAPLALPGACAVVRLIHVPIAWLFDPSLAPAQVPIACSSPVPIAIVPYPILSTPVPILLVLLREGHQLIGGLRSEP